MFWEHYSSSFACISFQNHRNQTRFLSFFLAWSHIDFVHGRYWYFFPPPFDRRLFVRTAAALVRLQAFDTVIVSHSYTSGSQTSMTHGQVQTGLLRRNVVRVPKLLKSQHTAGTKQVLRKPLFIAHVRWICAPAGSRDPAVTSCSTRVVSAAGSWCPVSRANCCRVWRV